MPARSEEVSLRVNRATHSMRRARVFQGVSARTAATRGGAREPIPGEEQNAGHEGVSKGSDRLRFGECSKRS